MIDKKYILVIIAVIILFYIFSGKNNDIIAENFNNEYASEQCQEQTNELNKINKHLCRYCSVRETDFDKLNRVTLNNALDCRWYDDRAITHGYNKDSWCSLRYPSDIRNKRVVNSNAFLTDREIDYMERNNIKYEDMLGEKINNEKREYTGSIVDNVINDNDDNLDGPGQFIDKSKVTFDYQAKNKPVLFKEGSWNDPTCDIGINKQYEEIIDAPKVPKAIIKETEAPVADVKVEEGFQNKISNNNTNKMVKKNIVERFDKIGPHEKHGLHNTWKYEFPIWDLTYKTDGYREIPQRIQNGIKNRDYDDIKYMSDYVDTHLQDLGDNSIYHNSDMDPMKLKQTMGTNCCSMNANGTIGKHVNSNGKKVKGIPALVGEGQEYFVNYSNRTNGCKCGKRCGCKNCHYMKYSNNQMDYYYDEYLNKRHCK